jgi:hypothetical protein
MTTLNHSEYCFWGAQRQAERCVTFAPAAAYTFRLLVSALSLLVTLRDWIRV